MAQKKPTPVNNIKSALKKPQQMKKVKKAGKTNSTFKFFTTIRDLINNIYKSLFQKNNRQDKDINKLFEQIVTQISNLAKDFSELDKHLIKKMGKSNEKSGATEASIDRQTIKKFVETFKKDITDSLLQYTIKIDNSISSLTQASKDVASISEKTETFKSLLQSLATKYEQTGKQIQTKLKGLDDSFTKLTEYYKKEKQLSETDSQKLDAIDSYVDKIADEMGPVGSTLPKRPVNDYSSSSARLVYKWRI